MRTVRATLTLLAVACAPAPPSGLGEPTPEMPEPSAEPPAPLLGPAPFEDLNPDPNIVEVNLEAGEKVVPIGTRMVSMYTYNGQFPGPLLEAKPGDRVIVHFVNRLPEPTTVHWHGLRITDQMDGSPRIQSPVMPGETFTYDFVVPETGSYWYHPHLRANEQVEKGLYGPIVIRDAKAPRYDRERYLMLDDVLLSGSTFAPFLANHMEQMHGRFGNLLLANGKKEGESLSDVARVGEVERWRLVNTSNARTMTLKLEGAAFQVIASDGGPLPSLWTASELTLAVGQRLDLDVRYFQPGAARLLNVVATLNSMNNVVDVPVEVFRVAVGTPATETPRNPAPVLAPLPAREPTRTVELLLDATSDATGALRWTINGEAHAAEPVFTAERGETVRLRLVNQAGPEHPFHLHGQFFSVVGQPEQGLRDTWLVPGLTTVELVAYLDNPGRWMAHCHILEHAELGMMSEFVVGPGSSSSSHQH
jgi:FtsP/CotA-like multicopper oxidase with cupredoxin domain